jgi:hypothetical protein
MSQISKILGAYRDALRQSQERYEDLTHERAENAINFYNEFFKNLLKPYRIYVEDPAGRRQAKRLINRVFAKDELKFAAVDGTLYKDTLEDYIIFFGASYAVRGEIKLQGEPPVITYEKWSSEQDVSMVAYVPIPFAELGDILDEQFHIVPDHEKINLSNIHNQIMQLAEVFLLYDLANNATIRPDVLLWDQSPSGVMASTEVGGKNVGLVGYSYMGRRLTPQDVVIAYSRPYNVINGIPGPKEFRFFNYVLAKCYTSKKITIQNIIDEIGLERKYILKKITPTLLETEIVIYTESSDELSLNEKYKESWEYCVGLFNHICVKLFKEKDPSSLTYIKKDPNGEEKTTWMSPDDLRFLIAVGLRALIELCWKYNIFLVGIVKDSLSRHLSRNYLGAMRYIGEYSFSDTLLPWTDRTFLESLPYGVDELEAPWSTIEFDSVFMTLHVESESDVAGQTTLSIKGVRGDVLTTERLFLRSLAQFFLNKEKPAPMMGHVIFIDRLIKPEIDNAYSRTITISNNDIGIVKPIVFQDKDHENPIQDVDMFLLHTLTKNLFPKVIGYPDPLNKADWGAKSLLEKVKGMIKSSNIAILSRPLHRRLRDLRDRRRRV